MLEYSLFVQMFSQASNFSIDGVTTFNAASNMHITYNHNHISCKPRQDMITVRKLLSAFRFWERRERQIHQDTDDEFPKKADGTGLYVENEAELEAGSGGDAVSEGIGGSGGGIAADNFRSNIAFANNAHISAGNGGKGSHGGEGGHGGAVGSHNTDSIQHYYGSLKAGSGGASSFGQGGAGGNIGVDNQNTVQVFKGVIKSGNGGKSSGRFGQGGNGGSIGCGNH